MTIATSPYSIPAALVRADDFLGPRRLWNAVNYTQQRFLQIFGCVRDEISEIPEIETIASWNVDDINQFLSERGFTIELEPFDRDTFGLAAALKVLIEWLKIGQKLAITTDTNQVYPGVLLEYRVPSYEVNRHANRVISVPTTTDDVVYLTMLDTPPTDEFDMIDTVIQLSGNLTRSRSVEAHFPMVDLDVTSDLSWILELWTKSEDGRRAKVSQALRQTKLRMNEVGVRIEEGVAMAVTLESMMIIDREVINRPFLLWVNRPSLTLPLFVGYLTPDIWKEPASL